MRASRALSSLRGRLDTCPVWQAGGFAKRAPRSAGSLHTSDGVGHALRLSSPWRHVDCVMHTLVVHAR